MLARMLVWWDTASGELRFAFSEAPDFNLQSQIDIGPAFLCRCFTLALPRCVTDDLLSKILCPIIGSYNEVCIESSQAKQLPLARSLTTAKQSKAP